MSHDDAHNEPPVPHDAPGRPPRLRAFIARYDWMGPTIIVLSSLYFAVQIFVAWNWKAPSYSFADNTISDLGNTGCHVGNYPNVCSPRYIFMDLMFALLGVALLIGSFLMYSEFSKRAFRERQVARVAFWLLGIAGLGSIFVGSFPENTSSDMHITGAAMAIGGGELGILLLGIVLISIPTSLRHFMLIYAALAGAAAISFAGQRSFGLGKGTMERVAQYPESIWLILFGAYITRDHYVKGLTRHFQWRPADAVADKVLAADPSSEELAARYDGGNQRQREVVLALMARCPSKADACLLLSGIHDAASATEQMWALRAVVEALKLERVGQTIFTDGARGDISDAISQELRAAVRKPPGLVQLLRTIACMPHCGVAPYWRRERPGMPLLWRRGNCFRREVAGQRRLLKIMRLRSIENRDLARYLSAYDVSPLGGAGASESLTPSGIIHQP